MSFNVELLAPAGSYDGMKAAFAAGADAVYLGGTRFGARAYAQNLDEDALKRAILYAHERKRKLYLTVNTLLKDREMDGLYAYLNPLYREGLDAVIVQDVGVLRYVRDVFPQLPVHASTQMSVTGRYGAAFLKDMGVSRVVTARELSLDEIRTIHAHVDIEIESFVHGALCFCYSGQCLFSSMLGGRSGNRGRCAQPCRLPYDLYRDGAQINRDGERYLLSPKDICTLDLLPQLVESGICSFKIEGRMKRAEYTAGVVRIYRRCLDRYLQGGEKSYAVRDEERTELLDLYNRGGFSQGYYRQSGGRGMMSLKRPNHWGIPAAKGQKLQAGQLTLRAQETLHAGDVLEVRDAGQKAEWQVDRTVPRGAAFTLRVQHPPKGIQSAVFYRTHNEFLLKSLEAAYLQTEHCEKINGKLIFSAQKPAILEVVYGNYKINVSGEQPLPARNRPLTAAGLERQMRKTGGSGFAFDSLDICAEEGLFLPVQSLNALRRKALEALKQEIRQAHLREDGIYREARGEVQIPSSAMPRRIPRLTASVESLEGLEALCAVSELDTVYVDCNAFADEEDFPEASDRILDICHASGKRCEYIMPWIFRANAAAWYSRVDVQKALARYDGLLLRSYDEYGFLKEHHFLSDHGFSGNLSADWNLYTYNREARAFWREAGLPGDTVPPELNCREIAARGADGSALIVYGYQPLMVSAQCQTRNLTGCTRKPSVLWLRDRKKKFFAVKNHCMFCYNTIYNSTPLQLLERAKDVLRLAPDSIRLQFTTEDAGETARTAQEYADVLIGGREPRKCREDFTRGHFERGVE